MSKTLSTGTCEVSYMELVGDMLSGTPSGRPVVEQVAMNAAKEMIENLPDPETLEDGTARDLLLKGRLRCIYQVIIDD